METNKYQFYKFAESLGIKINDAQRLMVLANKVDVEETNKEMPTAERFAENLTTLLNIPSGEMVIKKSDVIKALNNYAKLNRDYHLSKQAELIAENALLEYKAGNPIAVDKQSILQASEEYINNLK